MSTACLQCGRIGLELTNGRCGLCRHITPAPAWQRMHEGELAATGARAVRQDIFHAPVAQEPLVSALLPVEEMERITHHVDMQHGRTLDYVETATGEMRVRFEFPINESNRPSPAEVLAIVAKHAGSNG